VSRAQHEAATAAGEEKRAAEQLLQAQAALDNASVEDPIFMKEAVRTWATNVKKCKQNVRTYDAALAHAKELLESKETDMANALQEKIALSASLDEERMGWLTQLRTLRADEKRLADDRTKHNKVRLQTFRRANTGWSPITRPPHHYTPPRRYLTTPLLAHLGCVSHPRRADQIPT
jgi:hypothetical protein